MYSSGSRPISISCKSVHGELERGVDDESYDNIDTNDNPAVEDFNATPSDDDPSVDFADTAGEVTQGHPQVNGHNNNRKMHANTLIVLVLILMM